MHWKVNISLLNTNEKYSREFPNNRLCVHSNDYTLVKYRPIFNKLGLNWKGGSSFSLSCHKPIRKLEIVFSKLTKTYSREFPKKLLICVLRWPYHGQISTNFNKFCLKLKREIHLLSDCIKNIFENWIVTSSRGFLKTRAAWNLFIVIWRNLQIFRKCI